MNETLVERAMDALLDPEIAHVVDLLLCRRDGEVHAYAQSGSCGFTREGLSWSRGANPLERQSPAAFAPLEAELAAIRPPQNENHYPFAYDNAAQMFEDPRAPDIAVIHSPAHNWEERGGHRGEHGSLDVVQSRAPLALSGCGVRRQGRVDAAARMIDVSPTLAALLGIEPDRNGRRLNGQNGRALDEALDSDERPEHVVGILCDGTNANVLYAMADAGELPGFARLLGAGTTYGWGLMASFPSATLANHTTALTGAHPGRHGVLHNAYFDRATGRQVLTNAPERWHLARNELSADVETLFEAASRTVGGFTAAVNEPIDRGAGYATFDVVRKSGVAEMSNALPAPEGVPGTTRKFAEASREYAWSSSADFLAVHQVRSLWSGEDGNPRPRFLWINLILPDAANHAGGPHSEMGYAGLRDTDARLGEILDVLGDAADRTAFMLLADHGMEETDPGCKGDYGTALTRAGIPFRDEAFGFLYLGELPDEQART